MPIRHAVILSAGKGSRLLPLTADRPKCLIEFAGRTLLDWQLDALFAAGIETVTIVTGFRPDLIEATVAARGPAVATLFNPFYHVADNLGSVWMARAAFAEDTLLLNGDTLIPPAIVARVLAAPASPIAVTVDDGKTSYDADDMKVLRDGGRLLRIGKTLAPGEYDAESIGLLRFIGEGRAAFIDTVDRAMRTPEGTTSFYLRVIDQLAASGVVSATPITGIAWAEVDYPGDVEIARALTARWAGGSTDGWPAR